MQTIGRWRESLSRARNLGTSASVDPNSPPFPSSPRLSRSHPHVDAHLVEPVLAIVREVTAREIMPRYLKVAHSRKADGSLFTEADLATQDALKSALSALVPVPVLAEEMTQQEQALQWLEGDAGLWCVDPIDGTSNFVNGLPYFAVSVALMRQGRPVLGVVYDPVADEAFHAAHGCGAFLNGEQLPIKTYVPVLENAMAGVDLKRLEPGLARSLATSPPYMSQRNYGASTLEWCYAAAGRFDVYLHGGQRLWDYAAGVLIMAEAGGCICSMDYDDFWAAPLWRRSVIAALDPVLFEAWKTWLRARAGDSAESIG
jgi:myo-inositol-1(or 4)-monophosphatase